MWLVPGSQMRSTLDGGQREAELLLFSPLPVSWPSLLFEGQEGVSSMFNPFPSVCACCRNALFYCALFHQSLCSVFTATALHFLVSQLPEAPGCSVLLFHSNILPLVCDWAEGSCEFCTLSFPTPPFLMSA